MTPINRDSASPQNDIYHLRATTVVMPAQAGIQFVSWLLDLAPTRESYKRTMIKRKIKQSE